MKTEILQHVIAKLIEGAVEETLTHFIEYLYAEMDEQKRTLQRIEGMVEQQLTKHFKTGITFLEEAKHASNKEEQRQYLQKAKDEFAQASNLEPPNFPLMPIQSQFYVGICYELLGDSKNAMRWWHEKTLPASIQFEDALDKKLRSAIVSLRWGEAHSGLTKFFGEVTGKIDNLRQNLEMVEQRHAEVCNWGHAVSQLLVSLPAERNFFVLVPHWSTLFPFMTANPKPYEKIDISIKSVAYSLNGVLAGCAEDYHVLVWDTKSAYNKPIYEIYYGEVAKYQDLFPLSVSPDGALLAVGGREGVKVWDIRNKDPQLHNNPNPLYQLKVNDYLGDHDVSNVTFLSEKTLLTISELTTLWELNSGNELKKIYQVQRYGFRSIVSMNGSKIASGGDGSIWLI